jgi:hypothetical protein
LYKKTAYKTLSTSRLIRKRTLNKTNIYTSTTIAVKLKEEEDRYSCWCFLLMDGARFEAKIIHKGRGKFKILNDEYGGKYNNKIVDASDVIRCKIES